MGLSDPSPLALCPNPNQLEQLTQTRDPNLNQTQCFKCYIRHQLNVSGSNCTQLQCTVSDQDVAWLSVRALSTDFAHSPKRNYYSAFRTSSPVGTERTGYSTLTVLRSAEKVERDVFFLECAGMQQHG